jgi:hypothetical protein
MASGARQPYSTVAQTVSQWPILAQQGFASPSVSQISFETSLEANRGVDVCHMSGSKMAAPVHGRANKLESAALIL